MPLGVAIQRLTAIQRLQTFRCFFALLTPLSTLWLMVDR